MAVQWTSLPRRKPQGAPACLEDQAKAAALSLLGEHTRSLLDMLPCYCSLLSPTREILWANRALLKEVGHGIGMRCYQVYRARQNPCPDCQLGPTLEQGSTSVWEENLRGSGLAATHTLVQAVPLRGAGPGIPAALKISVDITQLRARERQLELSQREYRALFEGVPCYISVQDRDFRILKTNRLFETDFGRPQGRKCYQLYKGKQQKCEPCPVERTFEDGQIHFSEETVRRSSWEPMDVVVYTAPIRDHLGQTFAVMEMSTEITQVKRLQRELAALGQAVAITAHSIKNILSGLEGGAYVVQSGLRRADQALAQKGWEMVRDGVEMASRLVQDILLISKGRTPDYRSVSPLELADQVLALFQKRAADLGVELCLAQPESGMEPIVVDPSAIHTALANVVSNGLDACASVKGPGARRVLLRVVELPQERSVAFQVEDNGVGVPPEIQEKLFGEMVSTKGSAGTGLGLVVTQKILREHGGKARFHPRAGGGSVFELVIPRLGSLQGSETAREIQEG